MTIRLANRPAKSGGSLRNGPGIDREVNLCEPSLPGSKYAYLYVRPSWMMHHAM